MCDNIVYVGSKVIADHERSSCFGAVCTGPKVCVVGVLLGLNASLDSLVSVRLMILRLLVRQNCSQTCVFKFWLRLWILWVHIARKRGPDLSIGWGGSILFDVVDVVVAWGVSIEVIN